MSGRESLSSRTQHCVVSNSPLSKGWRLVLAREMESSGLSYYPYLSVQLSEYFLYLNSSAKALSIFCNISFPRCNIPVANCHPRLSFVTYFASLLISVSQNVVHRPPRQNHSRVLFKRCFILTHPSPLNQNLLQDSMCLTTCASSFHEHSSLKIGSPAYAFYLVCFLPAPAAGFASRCGQYFWR